MDTGAERLTSTLLKDGHGPVSAGYDTRPGAPKELIISHLPLFSDRLNFQHLSDAASACNCVKRRPPPMERQIPQPPRLSRL
jgi:hypothetical protein